MFVFYSFHSWDPVDALFSFPLPLLFHSASQIPQNISACWLVRCRDAVFTFAPIKRKPVCVLPVFSLNQCCGPIRQWCSCPVQAVRSLAYLWQTLSLALLSLSICSPSACPQALCKFVSVQQMPPQDSCNARFVFFFGISFLKWQGSNGSRSYYIIVQFGSLSSKVLFVDMKSNKSCFLEVWNLSDCWVQQACLISGCIQWYS